MDIAIKSRNRKCQGCLYRPGSCSEGSTETDSGFECFRQACRREIRLVEAALLRTRLTGLALFLILASSFGLAWVVSP